jgi:hypothetical protein
MPEPLTIRALPSIARQASLPDPCLADPLRPETWRPLLAAREAASTTAPLALEGHA